LKGLRGVQQQRLLATGLLQNRGGDRHRHGGKKKWKEGEKKLGNRDWKKDQLKRQKTALYALTTGLCRPRKFTMRRL